MKDPDTPRVTGFVLVGGRGRRFGSDKARHRLGGLPASDVVARRLEGICDGGVFLVGRTDASWSAFACVPDDVPNRGPLGGVSTALDHAQSPTAVIVATDLWNVTSDTIASLVRELERDTDVDLVCATNSTARVQPLCAAWRTQSCRRQVRNRLESEDYSMHNTLASLRVAFVVVEDSELLNVNERTDLDGVLGDVPDER